MSAPIDDGGAAFPVVFDHDDCKSEHEGMSLRDYFAGQAIAFIAQQPMTVSNITYAASANEAYKYADALLAARKEKP